MFRFVLLYLIFIQPALANTGAVFAPVFGISGLIWIVLIIPIEGLVYKLFKVKSPLRIAGKLNIYSALWGIFISIVLAPISWIEQPSQVKVYLESGRGNPDSFLRHLVSQFVVMMIFYITSTYLENRRRKKKFVDSTLTFKHILIANSLTYVIIISLWFSVYGYPIYKLVKSY